MASCAPAMPMKIEVKFESRPDGGLRAYSENVPGFALSNLDHELVMADIPPVLEVILSEILGCRVVVRPMVDVGAVINADDEPTMPAHLCHREYVGQQVNS